MYRVWVGIRDAGEPPAPFRRRHVPAARRYAGLSLPAGARRALSTPCWRSRPQPASGLAGVRTFPRCWPCRLACNALRRSIPSHTPPRHSAFRLPVMPISLMLAASSRWGIKRGMVSDIFALTSARRHAIHLLSPHGHSRTVLSFVSSRRNAGWRTRLAFFYSWKVARRAAKRFASLLSSLRFIAFAVAGVGRRALP